MLILKHTLMLAILAATIASAGCGGRDSINEDAPRSTEAQLYEEAVRQIGRSGYQQAILLLERLELYFPFGEYTRRGQLDLIYAYYKNGDTESAIDAADEFIRENPAHENVDYAYYLRGLIYFERDANMIEKLFRVDITERPPSDAERSYSYFTDLVRRFPDSEYVPDAHQRMIFLRERLARFELHVANYYMTRGAWLAAVNRARNVVENFQDTPQVAEALATMARAYRKLGMDDLAADAERVLETNAMPPAESERKRGLFKRDRRARPERPASDGSGD